MGEILFDGWFNLNLDDYWMGDIINKKGEGKMAFIKMVK